jgi:hypothetical protein
MVDHRPKSLSSCVQIISEAQSAAVENDLSVDDELIELIKMLARAAAREDYRKSKSAETIPLT